MTSMGRSVAAAALLWLGGFLPVAAAPWIDPGERSLRSDIELLEAWRIVRGPVTAWPLPWAQLADALSRPAAGLPPHVAAALDRVRARHLADTEADGWQASVSFAGTTEPVLVRGFAAQGRDEIDGTARAEYLWPSTAVRVSLGVQARGDLGDAKLRPDGSHIVHETNNLLLYGGYTDQWWGPGWTSSMILSDNARPFPRVGVMRNDPKPFETPVLDWLGPWQANLFIGMLEEKGRAVDRPYLVGMRLSANPLPGLELGASRTLQICGRDRPCGGGTWLDALVGRDNTGDLTDPSNQLAGLDLRYSARIGSLAYAGYAQYIGEDEAGGFPSRAAGLIGASLAGPAGRGGAYWRLITEYSDTAASVLSAEKRYDLTYNHFVYRTGYRYRGRPIAHSLDNDTRLLSVTGLLTDDRGWGYRAAYHRADLNRDGTEGGNMVSATAETVDAFELGIEIPLRRSTLDIGLRYQTDQPNTPGRRDPLVAADARWNFRL
ncbi:MAG: capsule assembly Wzi family protein [Alphaproteobacteria bacterium]